jgi:hypothetical protein
VRRAEKLSIPDVTLAGSGTGVASLRRLAIVSGIYDLLVGLPLLVAAPQVAAAFGAPAPVPVINAQLNGVFATCLAAGYFWAARDVDARRGYLWVAGVLAKLAGAALFVADHLLRGSPVSFLLFAATDGTLGLATLALLRGWGSRGRSVAAQPRS